MKTLLLFIIIFTTINILPQSRINSKYLKSNFALSTSRNDFRLKLDTRIEHSLSSKLMNSSERTWSSLLRDVGLMLYKTDKVHSIVDSAASYAINGSLKFKRATVEAIITLYPNEFKGTIDSLFKTTTDPTLFSYLVNYYSKKSSFNKFKYITKTKERFPNWEKIPQLKYLTYYLDKDSISTPSLKEIFANRFIKGATIIYSLHRKDRRYPGITIIKKPNGKFVKGKNDSIFYVKQLALSVTNLPGYLSQGNTPQGIFSVVGFYNSPTPSIGPTAAVLTRIPFEVSLNLWYHSSVSKSYWDINDYRNLLPKSWQKYFPIYESFYAGKTGRRKIVMHGSVDDLSFYDTLSYAPLTPSKGCLTTTEIWDSTTGKNIKSDQARLMNAFFSTKQLKGFLVVIDIDDKKESVKIEDILPFIEN